MLTESRMTKRLTNSLELQLERHKGSKIFERILRRDKLFERSSFDFENFSHIRVEQDAQDCTRRHRNT